MEFLAVTAQDIGYWVDKSISVVGIAFCLGMFGVVAAARRRRANAQRDQARDDTHTASNSQSGPPMFNG